MQYSGICTPSAKTAHTTITCNSSVGMKVNKVDMLADAIMTLLKKNVEIRGSLINALKWGN